jgi:N-acetylneuraminic acid mutarotase
MDQTESDYESPVKVKTVIKFQDTALGKLISSVSETDTQAVFNLLNQKRKQIKSIQKELSMQKSQEKPLPDLDRITKSKFYLMPSIRKTPTKALFSDNASNNKSIFNVLPLEINVFWSKIIFSGWKPETRQEATLTNIDQKLYLIGGVSRSINSDINVCAPGELRWQKVYPGGVEPDPRFGHSALEYKGKIIVFGGGTNFNTVHKLRECLNGIKIFHPNTNQWEYLKTSGTYISTRKYHSAAIVGKHMFIYGGLNQKNNLLSDCALLNLEKKTWKSIYIEGLKENAFHTCVSVLNADQISNSSIYDIPQSNINKVSQPGFYMFGGIGNDKKAHNKLWIITLGSKPLGFKEVNTSGTGPSPRFLHSMVYDQRSNYIMIFGGRIDVPQTVTYTCFNDLYLLCMNRLMWVRVKVMGDIPTARSGHSAEVIGSNLYIFGGVSNTCYCSSDMYVLEINSKLVNILLRKDQKKKQFLMDVENYKARKISKKKSTVSRDSSRNHSRHSVSKDNYEP